jgi:hypothetical protein
VRSLGIIRIMATVSNCETPHGRVAQLMPIQNGVVRCAPATALQNAGAPMDSLELAKLLECGGGSAADDTALDSARISAERISATRPHVVSYIEADLSS